MRFVQKFFAVAAVFGVLAVAPRATAGFTPPSNLVPYLPASNVVTVRKVATIGATAIYSCSMGGGVAVPASTPLAQVVLIASANCSWQSFRTATIDAGSLSNSGVVNQAQAWWVANIYTPYYGPLFAAAKASPSAVRVGHR